MFSATFIQIFSKNIKIEEKVKAEDNRVMTGLSGNVLNQRIFTLKNLYISKSYYSGWYTQGQPCGNSSVLEVVSSPLVCPEARTASHRSTVLWT